MRSSRMASDYLFRSYCIQMFYQILVACLCLHVSAEDKVITCPENDSENSTFSFPPICLELNSADWNGAELKCQEKGGHLASILTDKEQGIVEQQVDIALGQTGNNSNECGKQWWLGLRRQNNNFSWTDNSTFNYGHMDVPIGKKNCVFLKFKGKTEMSLNMTCSGNDCYESAWKTKSCSAKLCFVCKLRVHTKKDSDNKGSSSPPSIEVSSPSPGSEVSSSSPASTATSSSPSITGPSDTMRNADSQRSSSSIPVAIIGGGVAGFCLTCLVICIIIYICYRRRKDRVSEQKLKVTEKEVPAESTAIHLSNLSYTGRCELSVTFKQKQGVDEDRNYDEIQGDSKEQVGSSGYTYPYDSAVIPEKGRKGHNNKVRDPATTSIEKADNIYWQIDESEEGSDDAYWAPADSVEQLYAQIGGTKFHRILRSEIHIHETIGSGEFGTVAKATWKGSGDDITVAVKMLNSSDDDNKIRFLQEGAVMGQFKHRNIVTLHGLILEGEPLILAVEYMENGDLNKHLRKLSSETSNLARRLLRMAREIASGMRYLAHKAFIHRDLATRNVMLDGDGTCKIGDFGLSRDLAHNDYYMTQGGRIPLRWTAPEAVMYRKYSPSSDIWSYGIVLYELWTVGRRPYDDSWSNNVVIEMLETGYRLPPPPGCSHVIYKLMIRCWHPDYHYRPDFDEIVRELDTRDEELLINSPNVEPISGKIGGDIQDSAGLYESLQISYNGMEIAK